MLQLITPCCSDTSTRPIESFPELDAASDQGMPCTVCWCDSKLLAECLVGLNRMLQSVCCHSHSLLVICFISKVTPFAECLLHVTEWNIFDDSQHEEEQNFEDQVSWAPENFRHIDESDPARHSYHRYAGKQLGTTFAASSQ